MDIILAKTVFSDISNRFRGAQFFQKLLVWSCKSVMCSIGRENKNLKK